MNKNSFGGSFSKASCHENDQPPEITSCHTAMLGGLRTLKVIKLAQETENMTLLLLEI